MSGSALQKARRGSPKLSTGSAPLSRNKKEQTAFLGFGSNLGDRIKNIENAMRSISESGCGILAVSMFYETKPEFYENQPDFINCAAGIQTGASPGSLLGIVKDIEKGMGRKPAFRNAPRVIDIDILLFGNAIIGSEELCVPHPGLAARGFVLFPLAEIAAVEEHPVLEKSVEELLAMYLGKKKHGGGRNDG